MRLVHEASHRHRRTRSVSIPPRPKDKHCVSTLGSFLVGADAPDATQLLARLVLPSDIARCVARVSAELASWTLSKRWLSAPRGRPTFGRVRVNISGICSHWNCWFVFADLDGEQNSPRTSPPDGRSGNSSNRTGELTAARREFSTRAGISEPAASDAINQ
jgi:hypothetical protein